MWVKYIIFTILFFILALFQASFFPYSNIFGANLNFVFILFFLSVFFAEKKNYFSGMFFAIISGFFLDVFSVSVFGSYIVSFLIINFAAKKLLQDLKETDDKYPAAYFIFLFLAFFIFNELFIDFISYLINHLHPASFSWDFLLKIIYNSIFASIGFYVFKRLQNKK